MSTPLLARIPPRYWALAVLLVWGGVALLLLRQQPYGLDEGAVRALLLNWTIVDNVANPIVIFGVPDLRALLFIPLGIYWPGNLLAAKIFTLLLVFIAALLFYQWSRRALGQETALIATGLLLISPALLQQVDALGAGPYLLLAFALGAWLDHSYRAAPRPWGGKYFSQMLLAAVSVSLHPAGLAYPIALAWRWYKDPLDRRQQRHVYIGVAAAVLFVVLLRAGWHGLEWWQNPLTALAGAVLGPQLETGSNLTLLTGILFTLALLGTLIAGARELVSDLTGGMLLASVLLGLAAADLTWALLALTLVLYYGTPRLIAMNEFIDGRSLLGQRGGVLLAVVLIATLFMNIGKAYYAYVRSSVLPPQDQLIQTLAVEAAADTSKPFRAASQWPARTLIAVKREVLPLPPPAEDGEALMKMIPGITHLMFDPYDEGNRQLAKNIAELGGAMETLALQPGGVIVKVRGAQQPPAPAVPN